MSLGTKLEKHFAARMKMRPAPRAKMRLAALGLLMAVASLAAARAAEPQLVIKTGGHRNFARAVFDCPELTAYRVTQQGSVLHITLSTTAMPKIVSTDTDRIKKVTASQGANGTLNVDIVTRAGATYKDFRWDNKIVIDIYGAVKNKAVAAVPQKTPAPPKTPAPKKAQALGMPFGPAGAAATRNAAPEPIALAPQKSVAEKAEDKVSALISSLTGHNKPAKAKHAVGPAVRAAPVTPVDEGRVLSDPEAIAAAGLPGRSESLLPVWNLPITMPDGGVLPAAVPNADVVTPPPVPPGEADQTATVSVSSLTPLRRAVFVRARALWTVMDATGVNVQTPAVTGPMAPMVSAPQVLPLKGGTAFRYVLPKRTYYPVVTKRDLSWNVDLLPYPPSGALAPLSAEVRIETEPKTRKDILAAYLRGAGEPLTVVDPEVGDNLFVVPTNLAGEAVSDARHMPDLDIIPAVTGMVVDPKKDGLSVRRLSLTDEAEPSSAAASDNGTGKSQNSGKNKDADKDKDQTGTDALASAAARPYNHVVVVTTPNGLAVTPNGAVLRLVGMPTAAENNDSNRLFDFPNWRRGGLKYLQKNESAMTARIAAATMPEERAGRMMDLAKLYFANNFGQEALAVLDLARRENPHIVENPDYLAISGAANAEAGHYNAALADLSNPLVRASPEVDLWIGYAAAATEQWKEAERTFPRSNRLLLQYPDNLAIPFTIYMAEAALHLGHTTQANRLLASINKTSATLDPRYRAAINYLRGVSYAQRGEPEKAETLWVPVAGGLDRLYHTKASLSLTRLLLQQKKITLKDAINRVDSLRFAWRGDGLEVSILHTLGALKVQDGQILSGMEDMKQAMTLSVSLNDDPAPIQNDLQRIFVDLFTSNDTGKVKPLQLVAIYNEFSALTPEGPEGNTIALNYIDDLIRIDLLDQAASQMQYLLQNGDLPESLYAAVGVKLTAVYLLDSKPKEALLALAQTTRPWLPQHILEERTLLQARALSQMNKTDDAIKALQGMHSPDAERLKADVLWRAQRWSAAATALQPLLPDPLTQLNDKEARYVLNDAVAWKLAGNASALAALKEKYQAAMAKTRLAATFDVVTRNGGDSALGDREQMLKNAGEVDMFKDFLESYKAGLGGSGS